MSTVELDKYKKFDKYFTIKLLLEEEIKNSVPTEECAVLLSGGVDSLSVAFAAANLAKKITALSLIHISEPTRPY